MMSKSAVDKNIWKPQVGEIHSRRASIRKILGLQSEIESSQSSSSRSYDKETKRPCLIWATLPVVRVLPMARFSGEDITGSNLKLGNNVPRDYVLKRILAVQDKKPFNERRSIKAVTSKPPLISHSTYLILVPVIDEDVAVYTESYEYFGKEDMNYIGQVLSEIQTEEQNERHDITEKFIPRPLVHNDNDNDNDNDKDLYPSSSSSSLPIQRSYLPIHESNYLDKITMVQKWLNNVKTNIDHDISPDKESVKSFTSNEDDISLNDQEILSLSPIE